MELNYLKVFFEVAKAGRFSEAAKNLHISQSALSRSVALLEEDQGVQLFERSKKGVTLTPVGQEVFRLCEHLAQTLNQIDQACRGFQTTCEGPLRFAAPDHVVNDLLMTPLRLFRTEFPKVVPSILVGDPEQVIAQVEDQACEFGLLFARVKNPKIDYTELKTEPMTLLVHPEIWKECKSSSLPATIDRILSKYGYISSLEAIQNLRSNRVLKEVFGKLPRIGAEVGSQEAQKRFCLNRGGMAYLARFMVLDEIKNGSLIEIPIKDPHVFSFWLAVRKGHTLSLPARIFVDRLQKRDQDSIF